MGKRIWVGLLLVALFAAMLYFGPVAQAVIFTLGAVYAVREMVQLLNKKGLQPFAAPAYVFAALFAFLTLYVPEISWMFLWLPCVMAVLAEQMFRTQRSMRDCFAGVVIFIYPLVFMLILFKLGVSFGVLGTSALLAAFACPLMGDTLAYFIGSWIGKHKLCPSISPKKTVEGSVASLFGSMLGGVLTWLIQPVWGGASLPLWLYLAIGLLCGAVGQVGDLFASSLKRWAEIKDFSNLFPGHGGVLDRVDSVLFCAPVVYAGFHICLLLQAA